MLSLRCNSDVIHFDTDQNKLTSSDGICALWSCTGKGGGAVMFLEGSRLTLFGVLGRQVSCKVAK